MDRKYPKFIFDSPQVPGMRLFLPIAILSLLSPGLQAGDRFDSMLSKNPKNVEFEPLPDSELSFYIPGFLPWTEGTIGVDGIESGVNIGADVLLKNLDMLALAGLEGRRGKIGFIFEGMYLDLQATGTSPGPLLSTVNLDYEQLIAEGTFTYRLLETDRAVVEILVGARYYYLGSTLGLSPNSAAVAAVSDDLGSRIVSRTASAVRAELDRRLDNILAGLPAPAADLSSRDERRLFSRIESEVDPVRMEISDRLQSGIGSERSELAQSVGDSGPIRRLIRAYTRAKVEAAIEERRAAASAAVATARSGARRRAQKKLAEAERQLSGALADRIEKRLNTSVSDSKGWVDPFVGLRGKVLLTDDIYFVARADYGGFGVSSDSIYNLYGAFGTQVRENVTVEIGVRSLGVDYRQDGFVFDSTFTGPFFGTFIRF